VTETRTMTVHILGHEYRIRSNESGEFVREVALYVDDLMHRISSRMASGTTAQVAVLAALNIAEELFRERQNGSGPGSEETDERLKALVLRVEEILGAPDTAAAVATRSGAGSGR